MIIIEGMDGSGKSHLARRLSTELCIPIAEKVVGSDTKALLDLKDWVNKNLQKGFHATIYDRHRLISEPIYSAVIPDHVKSLDLGFWGDLEWLSRALRTFLIINPIRIYCQPPFATVVDNLHDDPHNTVIAPYITKLYLAYHHRMCIDPEAIKFDYTATDAESHYQAIKDRIKSSLYSEHPFSHVVFHRTDTKSD